MELLAPRKLCDTCGSTLEFEMPTGFCPGCLLDTVLESETEAVPGSRINDYELLNEVARGGMGIVYRARQRAPSRIVALKMILPAHLSSLGAVERFRAEAEAAASLEHEGILPIYAVGEADGAPFYSMKFAENGTLSARIDNYRDKPREAAALTAKLARAVAFAHEHGILHRDLKPGNVLFDSAGKAFVSDFGLAKWLQRDCDLKQTLAILGTPYYMAPEQASDSRSVTAAADIYSLGAILYHLLAGRPPIWGETPMEVLHRAATEQPKSPRLTNARISRDLETICLKCLEKEPGARYVSAAALADDLERFCAGHTIQARPVGLANRAWRWTRRNPGLAALSVLSVALLVVLAAIFTTGGPTRASVAPPKTIAVLPFTTSSGDTTRSYFTSGMQEEILAHLRKINGLVTLSSRTIAQAGEKAKDVRELRRAVGASYVLQGNVKPANERVVVTIQLTDTRTAKPVWTKKFESEIAGISAVQKSIAEDVVTQLKGKLASGEKAAIEQGTVHDLQAYELYLQARSVLRYFGNPAAELDFTRPKAIELLEQAIARDPKFGLAYALLSEAEAETLWAEDTTAEQMAKAMATAEMAVEVEPQLAEGHLVLGSYYCPLPFQKGRGAYNWFRDKERGLEEWKTAERLAPNNAAVLAKLAEAAIDRGDWKGAFQKLERARQVEPLEPMWAKQLADLHFAFRHYDEAEKIADGMIAKLREANPPEFWVLKRNIALARGDTAAAALANEKSDMIRRGFANIYHYKAEVALMQHNYAEAAEILETFRDKASKTVKNPRLIKNFNPYGTGAYNLRIGIARRALGEKEKALAAFTASEEGFRGWLRRYPEEAAALGRLPLALAGQGRRDDALREIENAIAIFPLTRDPLSAVEIRDYVANAYSWTGDRTLALELLQKIVALPGGPTAGDLKLNPRWDDLREDPRLNDLVAEAAKPISL
jgi:serine/threonine protein kinase/tetratricopeptide (TPR) repeat protein